MAELAPQRRPRGLRPCIATILHNQRPLAAKPTGRPRPRTSRVHTDWGKLAKRSLSLAAALALMLVFVVPTSAHWSTTAATRTGLGTGSLAVEVAGDLDLTIAACTAEDENDCVEEARTSITLTNTGSLPAASSLTLDGSEDTCLAATIDLELLPDRERLYSGQLCDLEGTQVHLTAGLDPGAALEVGITVHALESDMQATAGNEYGGALQFSSSQWNDSDGWSHEFSRPITIRWETPTPPVVVEDPVAEPPDPTPTPPEEPAGEDENPAVPPEETDPEPPDAATDPVAPPPPDEPPDGSISGTIRPAIEYRTETGPTPSDDTGDGSIVDGLAVFVHDAEGLLIASTETDEFGVYAFSELDASDCLVRFVAPSGHTFLTTASSEPGTVDTDVASVEHSETADGTAEVWGWTSVLDLSLDESAGGAVDAVIVAMPVDDSLPEATEPEAAEPEPGFEIAGTVWFDDGDGIRIDPPESDDVTAETSDDIDEPEARAPGVVVTLYDLSDTVVEVTSTDDNGAYVFSDTPEGTYLVEFNAPIGSTFIVASDGNDEDHNSDIADVLAELPESGPPRFSGRSAVLLIEEDVAIDAGLIEAPPWEEPPEDAPVESAAVAPLPPAVEPDNGHSEDEQGGDG